MEEHVLNNDEYVRRYNELFNILSRAYVDICYLQALGVLDNGYGFDNSVNPALIHICDLLKTDLCIALWKICFDSDSKANTISRLKNLVCIEKGIKIKNKLFQGVSDQQRDAIDAMRNKALAHNDTERSVDKVEIDSLVKLFYAAKDMLNGICLCEAGVQEFNAQYMLQIRFQQEGSFRKLLFQSVNRPDSKKYKVITLCGSTRFKDAFLETQKRLTLEGNIVISVGLFGHSGDEEVWMPGTKEMLDDMHRAKIDMADEIFVINVGGYIGSSTRSEIEYALNTGKKVHYLEKDS